MAEAPAPPDRRARYREQTRDEAKRVALRQLAEAGSAGLSLNAIAKEIGLTGPALYRYFANRDALLTALILDGFNALADHIEAADAAAADAGPADRLRASLRASRGWALAAPHHYLLLYGSPVPGYRAPAETIDAAHRPMAVYLAGLTRLQLQDWGRRAGADIGATRPDVLRRAVTGWTRMHGVVSIEITGGFGAMEFDPALLFDAEIEALIAGC
jgi:AcrR family transcriptional regulator